MKKRLFSFLVVTLMLSLVCIPAVHAAPDDLTVAYVNVPDDWQYPCIWAWDDAGNSAFAAWPGGECDADPNNAGWYYCYLPNWATNLIVNANDGTVQTGVDLNTEGKNVWITVKSPDDAVLSFDSQTKGEAPEYVEKVTVHARIPASWQDPCVWAWLDPDGTNAFSSWPGAEMRSHGDDWYTLGVPAWVNCIIINANGGSVQTSDLKDLDTTQDIWVDIADDLSASVTSENPDLAVPNITVYAKVPADWDSPCLWAWLDPDGTNAFSSWPGEPFTLEGEWYEITVPGWVNSLIVNANGGAVQTGDMKGLDTGRDVWIVVTDADNYTYDYEEIAGSDTGAPEAVSPVIWIASAAAVAVAAVIIIVIVAKKKKK